MQALLEKHWHHLPQEEVLNLLDSDPEKGLDRFEAKDRQQNFGPNALTQRKGQGPLLRFLLGLFSNLWIWGGITAMTVAQLLFTYTPLKNRLFHTAPIGIMDWVHILAVGLLIYLVIGAEKTLRRHRETGGSEI
jgi:magnesium-transporting ATPase (P-type)